MSLHKHLSAPIMTVCSDTTRTRATSAGVEIVPSDVELVSQADIILSIIPPSEALATAQRIASAYPKTSQRPLYYADLNALSPATAQEVASTFDPSWPIHFIDGAILGGPPIPPDGPDAVWRIPRIVTSGAHELPIRIREVLVMRSIGTEIGQASALKMSFATLFKGFTSLAIQSFATAEKNGVYQALKEEIDEFSPPFGHQARKFLEGNIKNVPKKAYRWVREMEEINQTHKETGFDQDVFNAIAGVYRLVDDGTEVGRRRAKDIGVEDVLQSINEGLREKAHEN